MVEVLASAAVRTCSSPPGESAISDTAAAITSGEQPPLAALSEGEVGPAGSSENETDSSGNEQVPFLKAC